MDPRKELIIKALIKDVARRMNKVMQKLPAKNGVVTLPDRIYETLDDNDFIILWYMPVPIITTKRVREDMKRRAELLKLVGPRKIAINENISLN